jgi:subtilisin family serine protease
LISSKINVQSVEMKNELLISLIVMFSCFLFFTSHSLAASQQSLIQELASSKKVDPTVIDFIQNETLSKVPVIIVLQPSAEVSMFDIQPKYKYHLINAFATEVSPEVLLNLSNSASVKKVYLDKKIYALSEENFDLNKLLLKKYQTLNITLQLFQSVPLINAPLVWNESRAITNVTVAVLDTGIDKNHPDLEEKITAEKDFTLFDGKLDPNDYYGHGTHVAAIITGSGKGSKRIIDTSSTNTSGLVNLPPSNTTYHIGRVNLLLSIDQWFSQEERDYYILVVNDSAAYLDMDGNFSTIYDQAIASLGQHFHRAYPECFYSYCFYPRAYQILENISDNGNITIIALDVDWDNQPDIFKGVAPEGVQLLNGKVLSDYGFGFESDIIAGIEWAVDSGAKIISMSLGGWVPICDGSDPLSLAVDSAVDKGVNVVVAAGNSYEVRTISTPGCAKKAITVGATDKFDNIAWFSSQGPTTDERIKPDIVAPGVWIISARANDTDMGWPISEYYTSASGTSMATPHVAGVVALILQSSPNLTPEQVKAILINTAKDLKQKPTVQGGGRIDAYKAYQAAKNNKWIIPPAWNVGIAEAGSSKTQTFNSSNIEVKNLEEKTFSKIVDLFNGSVGNYGYYNYTFDVDSSVTGFTISIDWNDSTNDLDLRLYDPNGTFVACSCWGTGITHEEITIQNPAVGEWRGEVYGWYVNGTQEFFGRLEKRLLVDWPWFNGSGISSMKMVMNIPNDVKGEYQGRIVVNNDIIIPVLVGVSQKLSLYLNKADISDNITYHEMKFYSFNIPEGADYLKVDLNSPPVSGGGVPIPSSTEWPASADTLELYLFSPDGKILKSYPMYGWPWSSIYVSNPINGTWAIGIYASFLTEENTSFTLSVELPKASILPSFEYHILQPGEVETTQLTLWNLLPNTNMSVNLTPYGLIEQYHQSITDTIKDKKYNYYTFFVNSSISDYLILKLNWKNETSGLGLYLFDPENKLVAHIGPTYCFYDICFYLGYPMYGKEVRLWAWVGNKTGNWTAIVLGYDIPAGEDEISLRISQLKYTTWNWLTITPANTFSNIINKQLINLTISVPENTIPDWYYGDVYASFKWWINEPSHQFLIEEPRFYWTTVYVVKAPITISLSINKVNYSAYEDVIVSGVINNTEDRLVIGNLTLYVSDNPIIALNNLQVNSLSALPFQTKWNTGINPPGNYTVIAKFDYIDIYGKQYSTSTLKNFSISPTPLINLSATSYTASLNIGSSLTRTLSIKSYGNTNVTGTIDVLGSIAPYVSILPNNFSISPRFSTDITITFSGTSPGSFKGNLNMISNAGNYSLPLSLVVGATGNYTNDSISTIANVTTIINATQTTNTTLEIMTSQNISNAFVNVISYTQNPGTTNVGVTALNKYVEIEVSPNIASSLSWALIKIYYTDDEVAATGIIEDSLRIYYYNSTDGTWTPYNPPNGGVDTTNNYVWANTTHFSLFGIYGNVPTPTTTTTSPQGPTGGGGAPLVSAACEENWSCSSWSECYPNGTQYRICKDLSSCGTTKNKPEEVRSCIYTAPAKVPICGNNICETDLGENQTSCCLDCKCPTGYECKDNVCVEIIPPKEKVTPTPSPLAGFIVLVTSPVGIATILSAIVIFGFILLVYWKLKKK